MRPGPGELEVALERRFPGGASVRAAFSAPLRPPSVTVLFGPSGAGKTTVLRAVAGLDRPDAGHVRFAGEPWFDAAAGIDQPPRRRGAGVVFQEPALFPHLSVEANVGYGLFRLPRAARAARVREAAARVGVEALLARRPGALSGGQRQRVALARALAPSPRLLLLDEPLASLDAPSREELRRDLRGVLASAGIPALLVTHDREEALALGDWLVVLAEGGVRQAGPVDEVFSRPIDALVARAVGAENVLAAEVRAEDGGLVTVAVGAALLTAVRGAEAEIRGRVLACIRAEEVILEPAGGAPTSARNRLAARVQALEPRGPLVRVTLECGFPLVALVTRRSVEELGLAPGREVLALVKAPAVRLIPHA